MFYLLYIPPLILFSRRPRLLSYAFGHVSLVTSSNHAVRLFEGSASPW